MEHKVSQTEWNGVYYDRMFGDFCLMDVRGEGVTLIDAFLGTEYETLGFDEFHDAAESGEFEEVSEDVVRNPADYAQQMLYEATNAVSGGSTSFSSYFKPVDADFAVTATNLSSDDKAAYRSLDA
jgi:hypothetical protein